MSITLLHWQQLKLEGCPQCGLPIDDLQHQNHFVSCPLCAWKINDDQLLGWIAGVAECRICSNKQTFIAPCICDLDNLECDNCGNMSAEIIS
jgi:hypothetical protein